MSASLSSRFIAGMAVLGLVLHASACAPKGENAPRAAAVVADSVPAIRLERSGCMGGCPAYSVALFRDGRTVFVGMAGQVVGQRAAAVNPADVTRLLAKLTGAGFYSFSSDYTQSSKACGAYAADGAIVVLSARSGTRVHQVRHDLGCSGAPFALFALEQSVDSVAGVSRWIKPR